MTGIRLSLVTLAMVAGVGVLADMAVASTTGLERKGDPVSALLIMIVFLVALVLFCFAILQLNRMRQQKIDVMKQNKDIDGLIKALGSTWLGTRAARALGETGDERAVEPLIGALNDQRQDVRKTAAEALGKVGDARAIEPLTRATGDSYDSVRASARSALESVRKRNVPDAGPV